MTLPDFVSLRVLNSTHRISRAGRRDLAIQKLTSSLNELTLPPASGTDIHVRRLPRSCSRSPRDFYIRIGLRDAMLGRADLFSEMDLRFAALWLEGHSPRAIFQTLGISHATGYRHFMPLLRQLEEVCHD